MALMGLDQYIANEAEEQSSAVKAEVLNLRQHYIKLYREIESILLPDERRTLEAIGITLFDLKPHLDLDDISGARLLETLIMSVKKRNLEGPCARIQSFYDVVLLEREVKRKEQWRAFIAASQVPSQQGEKDQATA